MSAFERSLRHISYPDNTVLSVSSIGNKLSFTGCGTVQTDRISSGNFQGDTNRDLVSYILDDRIGDVQGGLSLFLRDTLGCNSQILVQGDYIYINPQSSSNPNDYEAVEDAHGLLVVGWGTIVNCSTAFTTRRTINDFSPIRTNDNPIPYVADFTTAQPPIARPFYCTMAFDDGSNGTYFFRHDWFFFHLPDVITLLPSEVYVNKAWNW
jgi:hypothetical protein